MPRIDAHTHLFDPAQVVQRAAIAAADPTFAEMYADPAAKMATAPDLRAAMAEAELDGAVAAGFAFSGQQEIDAQNEYLLGPEVRGEGDVAVLAAVNPALPGWERQARAALASAAAGFGELRPLNQGWEPAGPEAARLYGMAEDAGAVLLWHVSEPLGHTYPGKRGGISPVDLCAVAQAHPRLRMVAAHLGGGLSFYLQMPELREALGNVWFDTAAASLLYDERSVARLVDLAGPNRVLFASDYPLLSPRRHLERTLASLPESAAQAVCGGNASTLFGITHRS